MINNFLIICLVVFMLAMYICIFVNIRTFNKIFEISMYVCAVLVIITLISMIICAVYIAPAEVPPEQTEVYLRC